MHAIVEVSSQKTRFSADDADANDQRQQDTIFHASGILHQCQWPQQKVTMTIGAKRRSRKVLRWTNLIRAKARLQDAISRTSPNILASITRIIIVITLMVIVLMT